MKTSSKNLLNRIAAFTLIELLVVVGIIAILAGMLLPALAVVKTRVLKGRAKTEMQNIGNALATYETTYSRLPVLPGITTGSYDVTFGLGDAATTSLAGNVQIDTVQIGNSNIIAVLMNVVKFGDNKDSANKGQALNPQGIPMLNARPASDVTGPGVGKDGEYRDPWGNPYIISIDYSYDEHCRDAVYSRKAVSQASGQTGAVGLFNTNSVSSGNTDQFEFNGKYLIWSKGPDGKYSTTSAYDKGDNRDNVLGWTQ